MRRRGSQACGWQVCTGRARVLIAVVSVVCLVSVIWPSASDRLLLGLRGRRGRSHYAKKFMHAQNKWVNSYSQSQEDIALLDTVFCGEGGSETCGIREGSVGLNPPYVRGGTFLEIGALDGLEYSNTLMFEESFGWKGILVEAQPGNAQYLTQNRPEAASFPIAVCPEGESFVQILGKPGAISGDTRYMAPEFKEKWHNSGSHFYKVPCRPLGHIIVDGLKQLGFNPNRGLDFLSLDVEGAELAVIQTLDWSTPIRHMLVEMDGLNKTKDALVKTTLLDHGYSVSHVSLTDYCWKPPCTTNVLFSKTM